MAANFANHPEWLREGALHQYHNSKGEMLNQIAAAITAGRYAKAIRLLKLLNKIADAVVDGDYAMTLSLLNPQEADHG